MSLSKPKRAPAPPPPVTEDTDATQQDYTRQLAQRRGRASAILTGPSGAGTPQTASKTLLGS